VLLWLGERGETQPVLTYLTRLATGSQDAIASRYYPDPLTFYYFVSRAFAAGCEGLTRARREIVARADARASASLTSALDTALVALTLLNFGERGPAVERAIDRLTTEQRPEGSWPCEAFYVGGIECYGSAQLTTALCVAALSQWPSRRDG
jgi:hypothetical protein